jgi:very-short-patch-repair endonuclease
MSIFDWREINNNIESFDERVQNNLFSLLEGWKLTIDQLQWVVAEIASCESPIEQLLYIPLSQNVGSLCSALGEVCSKTGASVLHSQYEIQAGTKAYRLDFLVDSILDDKSVTVAVECDGHDFHEKTKSQAAYDKVRDRDIQSLGYYILRFTGSEIWKDPTKCANEVISMIVAFLKTEKEIPIG